ncbi:probable PAP1-poly(A) polymerase [Rhynchosporium secalis]|uniref:Poly(A) polymerase n=1 Tax=Rhynchosporium secalis TaxID=38038 RepID=A0A1E1MRJ6_RHYSE|nr:probable PAP1-poly(A) polymerase [Rhynchosporium secalis]
MASQYVKAQGVTGPLSIAVPTAQELAANDDLVTELKRQNNYENPEETAKRSAVLHSLQSITEEFVRHVTRAQGKPDAIAKAAGGKIETFGSFKLGVIGPGSDIDTLVVVPKHITKDEFFQTFPEILLKMAPEGSITEFMAKPDAYVPIMTFKYSGIDLDILFGRIAGLSQIPRDLKMVESDLLRGLEGEEARSLNGVRVADEMLSLVPQPNVFRTALRTIKLWSARRAIAGNIYGFPGGVAWAILVARVCQLYPKATGSTIVMKFFKIVDKWPWPEPVLLKQIEAGKLNLQVWNPKNNPGDRRHIMPIITPAYPSMCTTHNVTRSTMAVLQKELKRGGEIANRVMGGKAKWKDLFEKHTFFTTGYKYYLCIITASTTKETQTMWSGWVESKVRLLVARLTDQTSVAIGHPFNKGFNRAHRCRSEEQIEAVKGGSLEYYAKDLGTATTGHGLAVGGMITDGTANDEEGSEGDDKFTMVYTTTHYIGLELHEGAKTLDLSWLVEDFKHTCTVWDLYNKDVSALHIAHTKNYDLPDDLFEDGEVKPTKPQKKKQSNKRTSADESSQPVAKRQQKTVVAAG